MLIRAELLPDEFDRGYYGRLMRLNGLVKTEDFDELVARWGGKASSTSYHPKIISMLAGVPGETFVRNHTTIPFFDGIGKNGQAERHNDSGAHLKFLSGNFSIETRGEAYLCEKCVACDLETCGQSYWKRAHQIPGLFWCPEHDSPLRFIDGEAAFNRSPAEVLPTSQANDAIWMMEVRDNPTIKRYIDLSFKVMALRAPLDQTSVSNTLIRRAQYHSYDASIYGFSLDAMLPDVVKQYGRHWLETVMPTYRNRWKKICIRSHSVGRYIEEDQRQGSFLIQCMLACPILYGSAEEALTALARFNPKSPAFLEPPRHKFLGKTEELVAAYIRARGSYHKTDVRITARKRTSSALKALGLPDIKKTDDSNCLSALVAFFIDGRSFNDSASIGGISQYEMEELLRDSGVTIQHILKEILTSIGDNQGENRSA